VKIAQLLKEAKTLAEPKNHSINPLLKPEDTYNRPYIETTYFGKNLSEQIEN
jgi:hypothetical protein